MSPEHAIATVVSPRDELSGPPSSGPGPYLGATFGDRYQIVEKISEGSQARVFRARHLLIDRMVAVKVLFPVLANDKALVERFFNEGRAAGTLGHPNIVESLDMGFAPDGAPYLVMELLSGCVLAEEIHRLGTLLFGRAVYIASQVASAVAAAHARGIVHRDLKPENVFLQERPAQPDHVKVLDFGISKFTAGTRVVTNKGQFLGTPGFMAPEQIEDPASVDGRADVYALGATLYTMLCGAQPFGDVPFPRILRSIVEEEPRSLRALRPDLPADLVDVVLRAMRKSREERFQTMEELEEALAPFVLVPSRTRSSISHRERPPMPSPLPPEPIPHSAPSVRRSIAPWVLLASLACVGAGAFAARARLFAPANDGSSIAPAAHVATEPAPPPSAAPAAVSPLRAPVSVATVPAPAAPPPAATPGWRPRAYAAARPPPPSAHAAPPPATLATAPPAPSAAVAPDVTSCSPPFYFDGKKKIFKTGCI